MQRLLRKAHLRFDRLRIYYLFTLTIITLFVFYLYKNIDTAFDRVYRSFVTNEVAMAKEFAANIERKVVATVPDSPKKRLENNAALQDHLNDLLSLFATPYYRYVYLLQEEGGRLRYLADGTKELEQRGLFWQKFDPDSPVAFKVLKTGKPDYSVQKDYTGLWLTYYYPIKGWRKTLLIFDISLKAYSGFKKLLMPIRTLLELFTFVLLVLLVATIGWSVMFYLQRRKNSIDPLTMLYNRNMLHRVKSYVELSNTSVLMVDLDHFKRINDRYGHEVGDRALLHAARILQRTARMDDIVIRYGGEEFLLLITGVTDKKKVVKIAHRIHEAFLKQPMKVQDDLVYLTVSIGVVPSPEELRGIEEAIQLADKMLYIAKTSGRNQVVVYEEEEGVVRPLLFSEIRRLIEDDGLFFLYQPIVETRTGRTVRYEVLARLRGFGRVYTPKEFIPMIRGTLAYRTLSKKLVQKAFDVCREKNVSLSINFDVGDFLDNTLFEMLCDLIERNESLAEHLTIELLENSAMPDMSAIAEKIERLRSLGLSIALDDYGTGYAGLNYFIYFRPDYVKVDRSIVIKAMEDETILGILQTLQAVAEKMGMKTIAEGVENEEMVEMVKKVGMHYMQGYYFAKPSKELGERRQKGERGVA